MASFNSRFVGFDIEATDLSPDHGGIIELGAVRYENGKEVAEFSQLIDPGHPIPPIITSITGIREQDVLGKPRFEEVRDKLREFLGDDPIVGHNIAFDIGFLKAQGLPLDNGQFDTWKLATLLIPKAPSHSLESLAQQFQLSHPEAHRAVHDARVGCDLFLYLAEQVAALPPATAEKIMTVVRRYPRYSLAPYFDEIFKNAKGTSVNTSAIKAKKTVRKRKISKIGQLQLPLAGSLAQVTGIKIAGAGVTQAAIDTLDVTDLTHVFEKAVAPGVSGFELRPDQVELARDIIQALEKKRKQIIEVPSGLGRRESAVVAGLLTKKISKLPTVYVVGGKHEAQLALDTAQSIAQALGKKIAHLGTPKDYVSIQAVNDFIGRSDLNEVETHVAIKLLVWLEQTQTGEFREVAATWEEKMVLEQLTSIQHECRKNSEPEKCSYCAARKRATEADLVIMLQRSMMFHLLAHDPLITRLVIDDVGRLEDYVTEELAEVVHQGSLERLLERMERIYGSQLSVSSIRDQLTLIAGLVGLFVERITPEEPAGYGRSVVITESIRSDIEYKKIRSALEHLIQRVRGFVDNLKPAMPPENAYFRRALEELAVTLESFLGASVDERLVQITLNSRQEFVLKSLPIFVSKQVQQAFQTLKSIVLIGPRLTVDKSFTFIQARLGLAEADFETKALPGPTDRAERTAVAFVDGVPDAESTDWAATVGSVIAQTAQILQGRILVLFSSRTALLNAHSATEDQLRGSGYKLLAQGVTGGRGKTVSALLRHPRAVLMASHTFVEGLKFTHGFSAIMIVRLPFSSPYEPMYAARSKRVSSAFRELELPRIALKIREQFDRLVELPKERGVLLILDPRFKKNYANVFVESLPVTEVASVDKQKLDAFLAPFRILPKKK
jgi:ATP-dependent DNA helicase DinG